MKLMKWKDVSPPVVVLGGLVSFWKARRALENWTMRRVERIEMMGTERPELELVVREEEVDGYMFLIQVFLLTSMRVT